MPHPRLPFVAALGAAALAAGPALAQDWSVGIAGGPAQGRVECVDVFPCDRSAAFWKVTGAWRFAAPWDVQLAIFGSGPYAGGDRTPLGTPFGGDFRIVGIGATAGYRWTLAPDWSVAARVGAASVRTTFDYAAPFTGSRSRTGLQPLAGVGVAWQLSPTVRLGLDYDETRFKAHTRRGALRMFGAAAELSF